MNSKRMVIGWIERYVSSLPARSKLDIKNHCGVKPNRVYLKVKLIGASAMIE
jgi:hypothetical protein